MVKHTQTIRWQQPTNCSSVFDHFAGLALKGFKRDYFKRNVEVCSQNSELTDQIYMNSSQHLFVQCQQWNNK